MLCQSYFDQTNCKSNYLRTNVRTIKLPCLRTCQGSVSVSILLLFCSLARGIRRCQVVLIVSSLVSSDGPVLRLAVTARARAR